MKHLVLVNLLEKGSILFFTEAGLTASLYYKELTNEAIEYISIYVTKSNLKVPSSTFQ